MPFSRGVSFLFLKKCSKSNRISKKRVKKEQDPTPARWLKIYYAS